MKNETPTFLPSIWGKHIWQSLYEESVFGKILEKERKEKMKEWTMCKDGMPVDRLHVLFHVTDGSEDFMDIGEFCHRDGFWEADSGDRYGHDQVDCWMEIPEPPERKTNGFSPFAVLEIRDLQDRMNYVEKQCMRLDELEKAFRATENVMCEKVDNFTKMILNSNDEMWKKVDKFIKRKNKIRPK